MYSEIDKDKVRYSILANAIDIGKINKTNVFKECLLNRSPDRKS